MSFNHYGLDVSSIFIDPHDTSSADLPIVAPGLVDLQINGFAGHDVNAPSIAPETIEQMIRALWREGVATCFPTVITNSSEAIAAAMQAIAQACERDAVTAHGIGGIHLEGPFISPDDGARGAHDRQFVRPPDWDDFRRWQDAAGGKIRQLFGPSLRAFGQPGAGGSHAFADPENGFSFAYVMNQMEPGVLPNAKSLALVEAMYA